MRFPVYLRRTFQIISLGAALALAAGPAAAQQNAAEDVEFSADHLRLAQEVIDLTESDRTFDDILPMIADQTLGVFTRSNPALTRELETAVFDVAISMAARRAELSRTLQMIWARRFSEPELVELKGFFESGVGGKFVELTPVISALGIGAARQWQEQLAAEMVEETRRVMREQGYSL
ncbi:MAG: DUF2059 domain-containing protein [Pseudomonadota bacterium]